MPGSDWLPLALFGLAALAVAVIVGGYVSQPDCAYVLSLLKKDEKTSNAAHYEGAVTCERNCQVTFGLPDHADDTAGEGQEEENSQCETSDELDLIAQYVMAHWAKISAGLAMLGVFGLLWTLRETRRIGQAQARAYVSCPSGKFSFANNDHTALSVEIGVHNSGSSPARDFQFEATIIVEHASEAGRVVVGTYPFAEVLKIYDVGGGETQPKRAALSGGAINNWIRALRALNAEIGVYGQFEYFDVFGRRWPKRFALVGRLENVGANDKGLVVNELAPCHPDRWT